MTLTEERIALAFDPWAGDMDSDAVTLRDRFVRGRAAGRCAICFDAIPAGARVRAQTQRSEEMGKVMTFKFCLLCCEAMARERGDDGESIEARYARGMDAAARMRETPAAAQ